MLKCKIVNPSSRLLHLSNSDSFFGFNSFRGHGHNTRRRGRRRCLTPIRHIQIGGVGGRSAPDTEFPSVGLLRQVKILVWVGDQFLQVGDSVRHFKVFGASLQIQRLTKMSSFFICLPCQGDSSSKAGECPQSGHFGIPGFEVVCSNPPAQNA
jgi:hypothetical protein